MSYVYGLERIAQVSSAGTTYYYLPDGLGSTMALVDASGTMVNTYDYDVFGELRASTGSPANEFTFAGEQVEPNSGLQYLRARYYDIGTGRFEGRDKLPSWLLEPASLNPYQYVLASPTITSIQRANIAGPGIRITAWEVL